MNVVQVEHSEEPGIMEINDFKILSFQSLQVSPLVKIVKSWNFWTGLALSKILNILSLFGPNERGYSNSIDMSLGLPYRFGSLRFQVCVKTTPNGLSQINQVWYFQEIISNDIFCYLKRPISLLKMRTQKYFWRKASDGNQWYKQLKLLRPWFCEN